MFARKFVILIKITSFENHKIICTWKIISDKKHRIIGIYQGNGCYYCDFNGVEELKDWWDIVTLIDNWGSG